MEVLRVLFGAIKSWWEDTGGVLERKGYEVYIFKLRESMGCCMTCNVVWWGPLEAVGDSTQANCGFLVLQNNSCDANYSLEISDPICFQVAFLILKFCYFVSLCAKKSFSGAGQCNLPQHFHVGPVSALVSFETQLLTSPLSHKIYKRNC